jgi:hypothetical protein
MFGYDPDHPFPGGLRIVAFGVALYAFIVLNDALFWSALVVGLVGIILGRQQRRRDKTAAFERHLAEYVAGERDDLPGDPPITPKTGTP